MPPCKEYTSKRFLAPRRVPPYIAADCQGDVLPGTTGGKMYKSYQSKIQWRWNNVENLKKKLQSKRKSRKPASASRRSRSRSRSRSRKPASASRRSRSRSRSSSSPSPSPSPPSFTEIMQMAKALKPKGTRRNFY
jgi:hypothetical protein